MDGDFPAAAVVGQVMCEAEGFLAEGGSEFLLFFDLLLVKDTSKLIQSIVRIATQGGDVLRGVDSSRREWRDTGQPSALSFECA